MPETTRKLTGPEILAEVRRVQPAFYKAEDVLNYPTLPADYLSALARMADDLEAILADAYSRATGGFEGEDFIVGHSRGLYTAAAIVARAVPQLSPEDAERARGSLTWISLMLADLAKRAGEMSNETEAVHA